MSRPFLRNISLNHGSIPFRFNILFLGQDEFSCCVFKRLYATPDIWKTIWVATNPDAKTGRNGKNIAISPLKTLARSLNISPHDLPQKHLGMHTWEIPEVFRNTPQDPRNILVTASIGRIIPDSMLKLFGESRRLNVHPSLLPLYRGAAPIQHAIADGQRRTGVSILNLEPFKQGLDTGNIWASQVVSMPEKATFVSMRDELAIAGGDLLVSTLRGLATGKATASPQIASEVTLAPLITRHFTEIDCWEAWEATRLDRVHRAVRHQHALVCRLPYGPMLQLEQLAVRPASEPLHRRLYNPGDAVYDNQTESIIIRCANSTEVAVTSLQQENKRVLGPKDFWNGIRPEGLQDGILKLRPFSSSNIASGRKGKTEHRRNIDTVCTREEYI